MRHGAGAAVILERASSPLTKDVLFMEATTLGFTFKGAGEVLPEKPALLMQVEDIFLALATLVVQGTFKYGIE